MRKDIDIFEIFAEELSPGLGVVYGDEKFPKLLSGNPVLIGHPDTPRNRTAIVKLLEDNADFSEWFYKDNFGVSDESIRKGINLISQIYFPNGYETGWESVMKSIEGETQSNVYETLIHLTVRSVDNDLNKNKGRKIRAMIEQSPLPILDTLLENDDVRERMNTSLFNREDLEALVVASAIITIATTAIEEWDNIVRAGVKKP